MRLAGLSALERKSIFEPSPVPKCGSGTFMTIISLHLRFFSIALLALLSQIWFPVPKKSRRVNTRKIAIFVNFKLCTNIKDGFFCFCHWISSCNCYNYVSGWEVSGDFGVTCCTALDWVNTLIPVIQIWFNLRPYKVAGKETKCYVCMIFCIFQRN